MLQRRRHEHEVERGKAKPDVVKKAVELANGGSEACGWRGENVDCGEKEGREEEGLWGGRMRERRGSRGSHL